MLAAVGSCLSGETDFSTVVVRASLSQFLNQWDDISLEMCELECRAERSSLELQSRWGCVAALECSSLRDVTSDNQHVPNVDDARAVLAIQNRLALS